MNSLSPNGDMVGAFTHYIARVAHVVQGPYYLGTNIPDLNYNDPTDIGNITFQLINSNQSSTLTSNGNLVAKPISLSLIHI